ncbi:MAG: glycosyltransferase family 61 protein [Actinomycetota bacterium]
MPIGDPLRAARVMQPDYWVETPEPIEAPSIWLLRHAHVMGGVVRGRTAEGLLGGQLILTSNGEMIPASYGVTDGNQELSIDRLERRDDEIFLKRVPEPKYLEGIYFFLGAVNRHFGHTLLEGLTRLWALDALSQELLATVKFVVYEDSLYEYTKTLLRLAGVPEERIVYASPHDVIESLIVPDASMRTHRWITKFQSQVWDRMSAMSGVSNQSRRIFLSRKNIGDRRLRNEAEVESLFAEAGYEIICPEALPILDQVRMATESVSLAGCVGSQMYLAAFQRPGSVNLILGPRNFYLKDDVLIHRAKDLELEVVLGSKVDFNRPKNEMSWDVSCPSVSLAVGKVFEKLRLTQPSSSNRTA